MDTLISIGRPSPEFRLPDLDGQVHTLGETRGRITLINFWSAECPWSRRVDRALLPAWQRWGDAVVLLTVACNTNEPVDLLQRTAIEHGLPLVLRDPNQQVADLYQAQTTPHFFISDAQGILRYMGAYDDVTFRQRTPTRAYVLEAVEALLARRQPDPALTPAYGCAIMRFV